MRISDWSSDVCSSDLGVEAMNQMPAELPGVEPNDRLKAIFARTVEKMKEVVREFEITQDELPVRSEEHTSELQSLMRISYAVLCLKKKTSKSPHVKKHHLISTPVH